MKNDHECEIFKKKSRKKKNSFRVKSFNVNEFFTMKLDCLFEFNFLFFLNVINKK